MSRRHPQLYLQDILNSINSISEYTANFTKETFVKDGKTIDAVVRNLEIVGEAARALPAEIKDKYPDLPWSYMVTMRNKVLHEYFGVDEEILWQTIQEDLPPLKEQINKLLAVLPIT